jgi:hypothetical protein
MGGQPSGPIEVQCSQACDQAALTTLSEILKVI